MNKFAIFCYFDESVTDGPTDRQTDRRTDPLYSQRCEIASKNLKVWDYITSDFRFQMRPHISIRRSVRRSVCQSVRLSITLLSKQQKIMHFFTSLDFMELQPIRNVGKCQSTMQSHHIYDCMVLIYMSESQLENQSITKPRNHEDPRGSSRIGNPRRGILED